MKAILTLLLAAVLLGCHKRSTEDSPASARLGVHMPTALVAVIADPVRFDGKTVFVTGFYRHGFEMSGLFPSRDMSFDGANGLWVDSSADTSREPAAGDPSWLNEGALWLQVEGVIDADAHGHLGQWTATIHAKKIKAYPVDWLDDRTK